MAIRCLVASFVSLLTCIIAGIVAFSDHQLWALAASVSSLSSALGWLAAAGKH